VREYLGDAPATDYQKGVDVEDPKIRLGDDVIYREVSTAHAAKIVDISEGQIELAVFQHGEVFTFSSTRGNDIGQFQYPALLEFDELGNPDYSKTDKPEHKDCPDYDSAAGICEADGAACHVKGNVANCGEGHHE
jgi:hypothetical protein